MLRLYKQTASTTFYWEAWQLDDWFIYVHHGELGSRGNFYEEQFYRPMTAEECIEKESRPLRDQGYAELPIEQYVPLLLQFETGQHWGNANDLDKRRRAEDLLSETLDWTGNGFCNGGDVGSGIMNVYAFVVDVDIACKTIVAELEKARILDGVIAVGVDGEYRVIWPKRAEWEF